MFTKNCSVCLLDNAGQRGKQIFFLFTKSTHKPVNVLIVHYLDLPFIVKKDKRM